MSACKVGALLDEAGPLDAADRLTLAREARHLPTVPTTVSAAILSTALRRLGHDVGPTTIKDHRASRCACTRKADG